MLSSEVKILIDKKFCNERNKFKFDGPISELWYGGCLTHPNQTPKISDGY